MGATEWFMKAQIEQLREENKNWGKKYIDLADLYTEKVIENEKLKLQIAELMWERDWKQMKIEELEKEIDRLNLLN